MSLLAIVTMVFMLAVYFGGFVYFALRRPPGSRADETDTPPEGGVAPNGRPGR